MPKTPSYRRRPGYTQAIVTLTDSVTKKRRDFWLGPHGTKESREQYHRVIAEWEANGRRFPRAISGQTAPNKPAGLKLVVLLREFYRWAKRNYDKGELRSFYIVMVLIRRDFGLEAAQLALDHASASITDAVYAERDRGKVIEVMRSIG